MPFELPELKLKASGLSSLNPRWESASVGARFWWVPGAAGCAVAWDGPGPGPAVGLAKGF